MKIPIKKWVDDPTKTWKLRFNELKAHHEEETKWSLSRRIIMTNKLTQTEAALIAQKLFGPHGTAWVGRPEDNSSGGYNSYPGNQCMVGIITYVVKSFWFIKWKHGGGIHRLWFRLGTSLIEREGNVALPFVKRSCGC